MSHTPALQLIGRDVASAARSLRRAPGLAAVVILMLGLGIGSTAALFAVVKSALLTPLPYGRSREIVTVWSAWTGFERTWLSYDEFEAWKADIPAFADVGIYADESVNLTGGDRPERVRGARVGANVFSVLGVSPAIGRGFTEEEDRPGGPAAAVISFELWSRRFGADPAVLGRPIPVNGVAVPLVGVLPAGFRMPLDFGAEGRTDVYQPLATDAAANGALPGPAIRPGGGNHGFYGVARLAPAMTPALANRQLQDRVAALVRDGVFPAEMQFQAFVVPIAEQIRGTIRSPLLILQGAVGLVLLIACANVAGLLLVRGERRRRELAVRIALGAGRAGLSRMLFAETGLLAGAATALGMAVAWLGVEGVKRFAPASLPRVAEARVDPVLLLVALGVAAVTAILTGILPALQASGLSPAREVHEGGRGASPGPTRLRWRQVLVTGEIALAVVLATGAGLLIRTVANLLAIDPGFDARGVLTLRLSTPSTWYPDPSGVAAFWTRLEGDIRRIPGVQAVGAVRLLPLATEMGDWGVTVEGYVPPPNRSAPADWQVLSPGAFPALGYRLAEGRLLQPSDDQTGTLAMVVNRSFADAYLAGRAAVGATVRVGRSGPDYRIVGVIENARHNTLRSDVKPGFYVTMPQFSRAPGNTVRSMSLVIRADGSPKALIESVRATIGRIDPRLPVSEVRTMDEIVGASIAAQAFAMRLLVAFGLMALMLSAIGIFGVVSHSMAIRRREFGIRSALGARPAQLLRLALRSGLRYTTAGIGLGVGLALLSTGTLRRVLEGVTPTDALTFGTVVLVTGAVSFGASLLPAARAAGAPPNVVLRAD